MVKCKYCNAENQPDDIFCHKCGKDLNETVEKPQFKKHKISPASIIKRLIILIIICICAVLVYLVVYPSLFDKPELPYFSQDEITLLNKQLNSLQKKKEPLYTLTTDELTYLYNKSFIDKDMKTKPLFLSINDEGNLCFTVMIPLINSISLKTPLTAIVTPTYSNTKKGERVSGFRIEKINLGYIELPKSYYEEYSKYFNGYLNSKTEKILKMFVVININKNKTITFILPTKKRLF